MFVLLSLAQTAREVEMPASIQRGFIAVLISAALGGCLEPNPAYQVAPDLTASVDGNQARPRAVDRDGGMPRYEGVDPSIPPLVLTELMANPAAVPDSYGEWIEIFNPGHQPVDLNGWTLMDKHKDRHVILAEGPLWVRPKGYLVLGRSANKLENGGLNVAYAYRHFYLSNSADEIILVSSSGETVVSVSYSQTAGWTIPEGASLSVRIQDVGYSNGDVDDADDDGKKRSSSPSSWCTEVAPWPGSQGDSGTPGLSPGC
jgi:hypothetical protein